MPNNLVNIPTKKRSKSEWEKLLSEYAATNLSRADFCLKHNIGKSTFSKYWSLLGFSNRYKNYNHGGDGCFLKVKVNNTNVGHINKISTAFSLSFSNNLTIDFPSGCNLSELNKLLDLCNVA